MGAAGCAVAGAAVSAAGAKVGSAVGDAAGKVGLVLRMIVAAGAAEVASDAVEAAPWLAAQLASRNASAANAGNQTANLVCIAWEYTAFGHFMLPWTQVDTITDVGTAAFLCEVKLPDKTIVDTSYHIP